MRTSSCCLHPSLSGALVLALLAACDPGQPSDPGGDPPAADAGDEAADDGDDNDTDPTDGAASSATTGDAPADDTASAETSSGGDEPGDDDASSGAPASDDSGDDDALLDLPDPPYDYTIDLPAHYKTPFVQGLDNTPADNQLTDAGATLGRVLFYDPALSHNHAVSCASCHQQAFGFGDPADFSVGFAGELTTRNSMSLADARWYASGRFFWDERAATLEEQVLGPIQSEVEMGLTLAELVDRVDARPYYADLFTAAFGDAAVTSERIARALAQFVRAMSAHRTRWDVAVAAAGGNNGPLPGFTAAENLGRQLFFSPRTNCAACHVAGPPPGPGGPPPNLAIFQPTQPLNNGLDAGPTVDDGVGDVTGDPADAGRFKSPSLRNVAVTGPYMHDGRFATLEQVIDFYDHGIEAHPNLDPRLRGPGGVPRTMQLTPAEKSALVAFLHTLTDEALADDPRFADPFVH